MSQARGGALIRNARAPDNWGTLGCVVQSRGEPRIRYILSAAHVIALNGVAHHGDAIEFSASGDGGWLKIAEFERFVPFRDVPGAFQVCDAAIARVTNDALVDGAIDGIGPPIGVASGLFQGMRLRFRGAGTGLCETGVVHTSGNTVPVFYASSQTDGDPYRLDFKEQILYGNRNGSVWTPSTMHKDSGALILDRDNLAVGLHIASTPGDYPVSASICTPILAVLDALQVDLETMPAPGAAPTRDSAAPARAAPAPDDIGDRGFAELGTSIRSLLEPHNPFGGVAWQLSKDGLIVGGRIDRTPGVMKTVPRVWSDYGPLIVQHAKSFRVPVELIVATICTESSGNQNAVRIEPGWTSDADTPHRVSAGLMQTLISTAGDMLPGASIDRAALLIPDVSIKAGTAYIDRQRGPTRLDPPQVACAYNAGSLKLNEGSANRWKMRQFPIGTGAHADRFTQWFNDCFAFFAGAPSGTVPSDAPSFYRMLNGK